MSGEESGDEWPYSREVPFPNETAKRKALLIGHITMMIDGMRELLDSETEISDEEFKLALMILEFYLKDPVYKLSNCGDSDGLGETYAEACVEFERMKNDPSNIKQTVRQFIVHDICGILSEWLEGELIEEFQAAYDVTVQVEGTRIYVIEWLDEKPATDTEEIVGKSDESTFDPWQPVVKQKLREQNPLGFSVRVNNALFNMHVHYLGQLVQLTEAELLSQHNFGKLSLREIKETLSTFGLRLGCTLDSYHGSTLKKFNEKLRVLEDGGGS